MGRFEILKEKRVKKMRKIHCLNPISKLGTGLLTENYEMTDNLAEAEGILISQCCHA